MVMPRIAFGLVEIVMLGLFGLSLRFAYRSGGRRRLLELLSAVPFGLLLEQGDIAIFGSYAYNQGFFIKLGGVPVAIALAWAMLITSSMFISDALGVPPRLAPMVDATLTILLDFSLDAIAIRQGLWHWNIPLDRGFFGVPAGNFYGWLFVAVGFSAWTRVVRTRLAAAAGADPGLPDAAGRASSLHRPPAGLLRWAHRRLSPFPSDPCGFHRRDRSFAGTLAGQPPLAVVNASSSPAHLPHLLPGGRRAAGDLPASPRPPRRVAWDAGPRAVLAAGGVSVRSQGARSGTASSGVTPRPTRNAPPYPDLTPPAGPR